MNDEYREVKELKNFVEANKKNKTLCVEIIKKASGGYYVVFKLNNISLYLCRQIRKDRPYKDALRTFSSIDKAVSNVMKIGYKGNILINLESHKGTLF